MSNLTNSASAASATSVVASTNSTAPQFQVAEVTGRVTSVTFPKSRGDPTIFRILCPNVGRTFDAVCDMFCMLRENDTIYAMCMIDAEQRLHVIKSPFVQPPIDRDSIIQCFMRALRQGFGPVARLYKNMSQMAGGDDNVISYLTGLAQSWNDTRNTELLFMFNGVEPEDVKKLLFWWHKERNLRRLYLFGLTKGEINACRMTCDEIYNRCIENPYTIPAIPIEKCDAIMDRLNKKPGVNEQTRGTIIRAIWKNLAEFGWIGTPTRHLTKNFPGIKDHVEALKEHYGMVAELETAYLKFPHKVETWVAEYITMMRKRDKITYDTPLDQAITCEDGTVIERHSAHYTIGTISPDQMKAVQGALDHMICVITGAAGTGKSSVVGQIIHNLELRGISYAVCSFTGKAVARIREITKKKNPATMHRLIANSKKNQLDKRSSQFEKDIPLSDYKYVLIDEASMITEELFYDFLQAYPNIEHLILVGDANQLSPIGWGTLFQQIIKSETVPVYKLTTNFRVYTANGERDGIILNANGMISHDIQFPFEFVETNNFSIIEGPIERVYDIIKGCFASGVKSEQIAILTPYNRSLDVLNRTFQSIYNVGARSVSDSRRVIWMIGDRVMLTENDQEIGVFNGETGVIRDITNAAILVDFGNSGCHEFLLEPTTQGRNNYGQGTAGSYSYRNKPADQVMDGDEGEIDDERTVKRLIHAFALTIDKSQGSEWDFVIGFIPEFNSGSFLCRNRIYTMCTRTKRAFWVVVPDKSLFEITAVRPPSYRCDNLARRLTALLPNLKPYKLEPVLKQLEMIGEGYEIPADAMDTGIDCDDFD